MAQLALREYRWPCSSALRARGLPVIGSVLLCLALPVYGERPGGPRGDGTSKVSSARIATDTGETALESGLVLRAGCSSDCDIAHISGDPVHTTPGVVASPVGTSYSVHHMVGADLDGAGPDGITCVRIFDTESPSDDTVEYDGIAETLRPDVLGTVATVIEQHEVQPDGRRFLLINTSSPMGTELFPSGLDSDGQPLSDACFAIGLDDLLDWQGLDTVDQAVIRFMQDDQVLIGPLAITNLFTNPWNGALLVTLEGGAGLGINGVQLEIVLNKQLPLANDDCEDAIDVSDGTFAFNNTGATTDGFPHPVACAFEGYTDIGSDLWYRYTAPCNGELTVDLCDSSFDTKVAVYGMCGRCPIEDDPIACNDDFCSLRSFLPSPAFPSVPVVQGNCYLIRVGGYQGAQGQGIMRLACNAPSETGACCVDGACADTTTESVCASQEGEWFKGETCPEFDCPSPVPTNDACDSAIRVFTDVVYVGSTTNATGSPVASCTSGDPNDVWHFWTADCTGLVDIETCSDSFTLDTTLAVFDSCGGEELDCMDDGCGTRSWLRNLPVTQGTTYFIRVAGRLADGPYQLLVNPCRSACCIPGGSCQNILPEQCAGGGGDPQNPGTLCLGDSDGNGINDACEGCPDSTIVGASPSSGTVDARQPHAADAPLPRQGLGSPGGTGAEAEPILVQMIPRLAELENCFRLCETETDDVLGSNFISSVVYLGNGVYELMFDHAITAGGVTTIEYVGDGSFAQFTAHPGNVDADATANATDLTKLIDCCLLEPPTCSPPFGLRSCDSDRSGLVGPLDLLTAVNLLNGASEFDQWSGSPRPTNSVCPP